MEAIQEDIKYNIRETSHQERILREKEIIKTYLETGTTWETCQIEGIQADALRKILTAHRIGTPQGTQSKKLKKLLLYLEQHPLTYFSASQLQEILLLDTGFIQNKLRHSPFVEIKRSEKYILTGRSQHKPLLYRWKGDEL